MLNNPLKYVDPTGHKEEGECGFWGEACESDSRDASTELAEDLIDTTGDLVGTADALVEGRQGVLVIEEGVRIVAGRAYPGQMIVRGSMAGKEVARIPPRLTHAPATHAALAVYTSPSKAAIKAISSRATALGLGVVYGVDIYQYRWGSKSDVGLWSTDFGATVLVDTGISLGPPATGAVIGSLILPGPGTIVGTALGGISSVVIDFLWRDDLIQETKFFIENIPYDTDPRIKHPGR